MDVVSVGPLRCLGVPWQPRPGARALTIVAKATFDLRPVRSPLAEHQEDPNEDDNHWDDDPARSVYAPSDVAPFKAGADVVLVGDAFAPHREAVRSVVARLVVAGIDKSIEVFGNRGYSANGEAREASPFVAMPLRYERAAGGADSDNPVGVPKDAVASAPNLVRPGTKIAHGAAVEPVGFGPISPAWPTRARLLGASGWSPRRLADGPLPADVPASFFNVAPADQQVPKLAADQHLVLENMSAEHPLLVTSLPGMTARAFAEIGTELEEVKLTADTLWIDTARAIVTLVFRGQLALAEGRPRGRVIVLTETAGRPLTWPDVKRLCERAPPGAKAPLSAFEEGTIDSGEVHTAPRRELPFVARAAPASARPPARPAHDVEGETAAHTATELPPGLADASPAWLRPGSRREAGGSARISVAPPLAPTPMISPTPISSPPRIAPPMIAPPASVPRPAAAEAPAPAPDPAPPPALQPSPPSLLAVSNAAAARSATDGRPRTTSPADAEPVASEPRPTPGARDLVELLWFDEAELPKIRASERWAGVLASQRPERPAVAYDDDPPPEEPQADQDRRDVFSVLMLGTPETNEDLERLVEAAGGERGSFTPPLALVGGELAFAFDELETLRATVTAVAPFASSDKKLKELVDTVNELLKTPWLQGSGPVAEGLLGRVREAFAASNRGLPAGYLDAHTERMLLEQRNFQRRTVFGAKHLRAVMTLSPGAPPTVVYLPEALAGRLPIYQRLRARVVAEVNLPQDQFESSPLALRAVAFGRVAAAPARRR